MRLDEAIAILEEYQAWRLGADTEQLSPKVITESIDSILNVVKQDSKK